MSDKHGRETSPEPTGNQPDALQAVADDLRKALNKLQQAGQAVPSVSPCGIDPMCQSYFSMSPVGMFVATLEGEFLALNPALLTALEHAPPGQAPDTTPIHSLDGDSKVSRLFTRSEDFSYMAGCMKTRQEMRLDNVELTCKDQKTRKATLLAQRLLARIAPSNEPAALFAVLFQQDACAPRTDSDDIFRELFDNAAEALFQSLPDGKVLMVNKALARLFRCASLEEFLDEYPTVPNMMQDSSQFTALLQALRHNDGEATLEARAQGHEGEPFWINIKAVMMHDANAGPLMIHGSLRDITSRKNLQARLLREGFRDNLTGLANRSMFLNLLDKSIARATRRKDFGFALAALSLDSFRSVKEGMGHLVAEELLAEIARRIVAQLRTEDICARLGNDEFGLILSDVERPADAIRVLERITGGLTTSVHLQGRDLFPRISSGIVLSEAVSRSPESMLDDADTAMHRAKADPVTRFAVFNEAMQREATERLRTESELRKGLKNKELVLFYQPIISLPEGKIAGFEALMRWYRPGMGLVSPNSFVPLLEETGLILPAGEWALHQACRQLRHWQRELPESRNMFMSVNVSPRQLLSATLPKMMKKTLEKTGIAPSNLKLELTESLFIEEPHKSMHSLTELEALGVGLAIDDFGTGYSSLSYLNRLPASILKIDKCFVQAMREGHDGEAIVRTISLLAKSLGKQVVAEGVETSQQLATIMELQCDYVQGYYFSKPLPPDDARQLLTQGLEL